jgi:hypothetical protein
MKKSEFNATGMIILAHVLIAVTGFMILMAVFEFPDVLRESAEYRFHLFLEHKDIIIPIYYFLALTGITQIIMSVLLYRMMDQQAVLVMVGAVFGVLCGIFQVEGFIRWPILIPYLATAQGVSGDVVAFVEGAFNRYAGMAIGEHLGFLMQAAWTVFFGLAILKEKLFTRSLGWTGILIGIATFVMSMESLGGIFSICGELTNPVESAWYIWLVFLAISLFRTDPEKLEGPRFGYISLMIAIIVWLAFVVPAYV